MRTPSRVVQFFQNMETKGIGYVRVSTDKQADRGVSLEAQVEKIRAMATVHDVELLDVIVDAGSASGRLVLNIMVSVRQWEREAIGERTRDAMRHKKAKLEFVGNAPYGFRQAADKRHVEPEPGEQAILERIQ